MVRGAYTGSHVKGIAPAAHDNGNSGIITYTSGRPAFPCRAAIRNI
jgi:hypothetical protein